MKTDPIARRRFFDDLAPTWNQLPNFFSEQERLFTLLPVFPIKAGNSVLDIGTGTGIALKPLLKAVGDAGRVIGLDISSSMVAEARKIHPDVQVGDAHDLPFPPQSFDCVMAFAVIPHLDSPDIFFKQSATVLRPGGHLVVLHFMSRVVCNDFHRKVDTVVEHDMLPSPEKLDRLAEKAGLKPILFEEAEDLFLWIARKPF